MTKIYSAITAVLVFILMISMTISFWYSKKIDIGSLKAENPLANEKDQPKYHFAVITNKMDDPFWTSIQEGVYKAAQDLDVAVEINGIEVGENNDESLQYLDIAIASNVDGIVTHVSDKSQCTPLIDKAVEKGIAVVTIEADAPESKRQVFVGTDAFQLGYEGGKLLAQATKGKAHIAVILESFHNNVQSATQNLKIAGFRDAIKEYPNMKLETVHFSNLGILSAEDVTQEILNRSPDIDAIFCTSSKDTIGAAQVVIDLNRVGEISIIGYDDLPDLLRYVEKGVVYATIVRNPVQIGYESIESLVKIKENKVILPSINTGIEVVTSKNLEAYRRRIEARKGQGASK